MTDEARVDIALEEEASKHSSEDTKLYLVDGKAIYYGSFIICDPIRGYAKPYNVPFRWTEDIAPVRHAVRAAFANFRDERDHFIRRQLDERSVEDWKQRIRLSWAQLGNGQPLSEATITYLAVQFSKPFEWPRVDFWNLKESRCEKSK